MLITMEEERKVVADIIELPVSSSIHKFFILNYTKFNLHGVASIRTLIIEYTVQIAKRLEKYIVGTVDQNSSLLFHYIPNEYDYHINKSYAHQYFDSYSGNYIQAFYAEFLSLTEYKAFCNGIELVKTLTQHCSNYTFTGVEYLKIVDTLPHEQTYIE